jgi:hypothetical protein
MRHPLAVLSTLALAGCLTHMPLDHEAVHLEIPWVEDFQTARGIAAESARPILLVLVAGEILDRC